jgi:hypothetical protein
MLQTYLKHLSHPFLQLWRIVMTLELACRLQQMLCRKLALLLGRFVLLFDAPYHVSETVIPA